MNPGSYEAILQGCTCDLLVNHRGHGTGELRNGKPVFIYDPACTVHSANRDDTPKAKPDRQP